MAGLINTDPQTLQDLVKPVTTTTPTADPNAPATTTAAPVATKPVPAAAPENLTPNNVASVVAPTSLSPQAREITAPETVAGQMNTLLNADSPYMQSAVGNANAAANSRGLLNSSMAVGAAQKAAIDSAMPIAQQDSTIAANAAQSAQTARQDIGLTGYKSLLDSAQQKETSTANIQANKDLQTQRLQSDTERQTQQETATANLQLALKKADINLDMSKLSSAEKTSLGEGLYKNNQQLIDAIQRIQTTPDSQMNAASKAAQTDFLIKQYKDYASMQASLYGQTITWDGTTATTNNPTTGTAAPSATDIYNAQVAQQQAADAAAAASDANWASSTSPTAGQITAGAKAGMTFMTTNLHGQPITPQWSPTPVSTPAQAAQYFATTGKAAPGWQETYPGMWVG